MSNMRKRFEAGFKARVGLARLFHKIYKMTAMRATPIARLNRLTI